MKRGVSVEAVLLGAFATLATIGLLGCGLLLAHRAVPDWLLPGCLVVGVAVACKPRPTTAATVPMRTGPMRTGQTWLLVGGVLFGAAVIAWGSLATPSRHWDGAVMWDVKTAALTSAPTLQQPFFREPDVYCHSRDYPLLQPLTIALCNRWGLPGRLLFAIAWLLLVFAVVAAARALGHDPGRRLLFAGAVMLTPIVLSPTSGGFDSGYGDGLLAAAMATIAFGVAGRRAVPIALGCLVAVLQKPEGLPYCAMLIAASWLANERRVWLPAAVATALAATVGSSLGSDLRTFGATSHLPAIAGAALAAIAVLWLLDRGIGTRPRQTFLRAVVLLVAAIAVAVTACNIDGTLGARLGERLHRMPRLLAGIFGWAFGDRFALTFSLPLLLTIGCWRRRPDAFDRALGLWLASAIVIACVPFLVLPLDDLERHLRSTLPRVLLHWVGVAWVFTVAHWPPAAPVEPAPRQAPITSRA